MRTSLACFALMLSVSLASSAPVPFSRDVADARVLVKRHTPTKLLETLRSTAFATHVLKDRRVAALDCLKGKQNPAAWLATHIKVQPVQKGEALRISLDRCPPKEALVLLSAIVAAYLDEVDLQRAVLRQQLEMEENRAGEILLQMLTLVQRGRPQAAGNARLAAIFDQFTERANRIRAQIKKAEGDMVPQKPRLIKGGR